MPLPYTSSAENGQVVAVHIGCNDPYLRRRHAHKWSAKDHLWPFRYKYDDPIVTAISW
jgi:hypothetical protein